MTTFDKREQAFEAKFAYDEELRFKAIARRNKLLGNWAAQQLGLKGEAATAYANGLVTASLGIQTGDHILRKVAEDLEPNGVPERLIAEKMDEFLHIALEQIASGNG